MEYREFRAMNADIVLAAEGEKSKTRLGFDRTHTFIDEAEKRFTRFSDDSELAQLNRTAGQWFHASADLFEVVQQAKTLHEDTLGLFNPAILDALLQAGYDRSMDELRKMGVVPASLPDQRPMPNFKSVLLDEEKKRIRLPEGMHIDLSGIAKGWIAEQAARLLSQYSTACAVNAGGDIVLIGLPEGETAWPVGLEDPLDPSRDLVVLKVGPGCVATSSIAKRRWLQGDRVQHHLIDPRTGKPAVTDWLSVTVICERAAVAEVYAKALLIAGPQGAADLELTKNEIVYLAVDKDGKLWGSNRSAEFLRGNYAHVE